MRNNMYDVARTVYGSEAANMQPVAFGYVPANKRGSAPETGRRSAPGNNENRSERNASIREAADHNG